MNHAITIGGLLSFGLALAGFAVIVLGGIIWLAAGNCPVPDGRTGATGCLVALLGGAMLACGIWSLL